MHVKNLCSIPFFNEFFYYIYFWVDKEKNSGYWRGDEKKKKLRKKLSFLLLVAQKENALWFSKFENPINIHIQPFFARAGNISLC